MINQSFVAELKNQNILPERDINMVLKQSGQDAYALVLHVVNGGILSREEAGKMFGNGLNSAWLDMNTILFSPEVVSRLPKEFCMENGIILLYQLGNAITAAIADPTNKRVIREAEKIAKVKISPSFAFREEILDAIEIQYKSIHEIENILKEIKVAAALSPGKELTKQELEALAGDEAVIELSRSMLLLAIKEGSSDIHIEPTEHNVRIRFRIDGVMNERLKLDKSMIFPLVSRLKILAHMNITERRRPQDGRLSINLSKKSIDFRISSTPTIFGEKMVLRVLGEIKVRSIPDIEELHFSKLVYGMVRKLILTPSGVFFITGPTGSGKTTTLFSALKYINKPEVNIVTVEDPVEYRLPGINQIQINHDIGLNFGKVLRSVLRQDPDVILIGEIRDLETAKIATEAALTGHLVLSTLHTNNAIQAITRLVEIGVEPFIVGPSIIGVLSQRLVRKICDHCKESYALAPQEIEKYFEWDGKKKVDFHRGRGCESCGDNGYKGRLGIFEMVMVDDTLRDMVTKNATQMELRKYARNIGYHTMRYDGIKKALRGLTTIDEVNRVTVAE